MARAVSPSFASSSSKRAVDLAMCLAFALLLRIATFGDPNIHMDEAFYFYVGLEMHEGAVPYVDIWDRKPAGLFVLYSALAWISSSVLSYQIAAWLAASYTAWVIAQIVYRFGPRIAGLLAATCYIALLLPLNGHGGQTPVFYNALIASAVWLVLIEKQALKNGQVTWRSFTAMLLCGLALTIKQTTLFEGIFLGLWLVWLLWRSGTSLAKIAKLAAGFAALGALPFVSIGLWYWSAGYWDEYWFAMVTSNLARSQVSAAVTANIPVLLHALNFLPWGALAALIMANRYPSFAEHRAFFVGWLIAAFIGFLSAPYFLDHYALPLLVPFAIICAAHFGRSLAGKILGTVVVLSSIVLTNPFDFESHQRSRETFEGMEKAISENADRGTLFIYEGPMLIFAHPDVKRMSPAVFPWHLVSPAEAGTSPFDQKDEFKRILAAKPEFVAVTEDWFREPYPGALDELRQYVADECELLSSGERPNKRGRNVMSYLHGNCAEAAGEHP
ncbi:ArnT family glycosyltransferase [Altererythrobacter lutimaris]|uniref:Glycosyltransferase RgtA/B/C/D-like domain-containing protein n=1 Tax=Altererythrobacter lutimaris TaxID=2743979 RepID=A0A850HFH7_9SPHN|nr:hypothetical protein [Altererythrobacter lutimaris]NVE96051.1 hypothetical protein [Altererythrobacter lutimaris]